MLNKLKLKLKCTEFPCLGHLVTKEKPETRPGQDKGCARDAATGQHQSSHKTLGIRQLLSKVYAETR